MSLLDPASLCHTDSAAMLPLPPPLPRIFHHCHTHPLHQVSTTRLAIRNIPASWDEAKLKAAFIAGVKARATKEKPVVKQVRRQLKQHHKWSGWEQMVVLGPGVRSNPSKLHGCLQAESACLHPACHAVRITAVTLALPPPLQAKILSAPMTGATHLHADINIICDALCCRCSIRNSSSSAALFQLPPHRWHLLQPVVNSRNLLLTPPPPAGQDPA
jgi:hypothetical protein